MSGIVQKFRTASYKQLRACTDFLSHVLEVSGVFWFAHPTYFRNVGGCPGTWSRFMFVFFKRGNPHHNWCVIETFWLALLMFYFEKEGCGFSSTRRYASPWLYWTVWWSWQHPLSFAAYGLLKSRKCIKNTSQAARLQCTYYRWCNGLLHRWPFLVITGSVSSERLIPLSDTFSKSTLHEDSVLSMVTCQQSFARHPPTGLTARSIPLHILRVRHWSNVCIKLVFWPTVAPRIIDVPRSVAI